MYRRENKELAKTNLKYMDRTMQILFSLRDISLTLGLLPHRRHLVWRDSVGVKSSAVGQGLKSECADIFIRAFSGCYATLTSPKEGEAAVYGYNPALF